MTSIRCPICRTINQSFSNIHVDEMVICDICANTVSELSLLSTCKHSDIICYNCAKLCAINVTIHITNNNNNILQMSYSDVIIKSAYGMITMICCGLFSLPFHSSYSDTNISIMILIFSVICIAVVYNIKNNFHYLENSTNSTVIKLCMSSGIIIVNVFILLSIGTHIVVSLINLNK